MNNEIKKKVIDYLVSHRYMRLATVTAKGTPLVRSMGYASDGAIVYFVTDKKTRKVKDISGNPNVAFTIDEDYSDVTKIQGIQMEGKALLLVKKTDIEKAAGLLIKKFPAISGMPTELEMAFFKIEPAKGFFLDYTKGFTYMDEVIF